MENRLKERLTGAAILVALIVLVVPEMFHGPRSAAPAGATAAAQGPPVRSYTIDLTGSAVHSSPQAANPQETTLPTSQGSTAGAPAGPAARPADSAGLAASTDAPRPATALEGPVGEAGEARPPAPQPPAASEPAAAHTRVATSARAARGRSATALTGSPAATGPGAATGWSVQLGLFAKDGNAQRLMLSARAKGFSTRISRTEPKGLYRVWIGGLADRPAAEQMSRKLHAAGLPAAIIRQR